MFLFALLQVTWFKKLHNALFTDDDILFFDEDSGNVRFSSDEMDIPSVDLININLDDVNFDEDDPRNYYSCHTYCLVQ